MSAVSAESPRPSADLTAQANGKPGAHEPPPAPPGAGQPGRAGAARGQGETDQAGRAAPAGQAERAAPPPPAATSPALAPHAGLADDRYHGDQATPGPRDRAR